MIDAKQLSILVGVGTLLFVLWQRHRIFNLSCMGIFFLSHFVFVLIGILAIPWLIEGYLLESYSDIDFSLIDQSDISKTILLMGSGLGLVFLGNVYLQIIKSFMTGRWEENSGGILLWRSEPVNLCIRKDVTAARLKLFFVSALLLTLILLAPDWRALMEGVRYSYYMFEVEAFYRARAEVGSAGRIYFIVVFSALPFLSTTFWILFRVGKGSVERSWAYFMVIASSILLLLSFQKRPLLIYLITLFGAEILARQFAGYSKKKMNLSSEYSIIRAFWKSISIWCAFIFLLAFWFFYISTSIRDFWSIVMVIIDRTVSRLALNPVLYVHYFPNVEPHYGFSNIGVLSSLLGFEKYADTIVTNRYFSYAFIETEGGSGAIGSLVDFYGAFGLPGFIICCVGLGMLLRLLDNWLSSLSPTVLNRSLYLFMLVFAYYLSQASFLRSLSGYGGLTFLGLWLMLKTASFPIKKKAAA